MEKMQTVCGLSERSISGTVLLMAALISLTTMTRMVEEQRTLIGTMKLLGYSKASIAGGGKYIEIMHRLQQSLDVFSGHCLEKSISEYYYQSVWNYIYACSNIEVPYNLRYAGVASAVAVFCVLQQLHPVIRAARNRQQN